MRRRELLKAIVMAAAAASAARQAAGQEPSRSAAALFFVPGYHPQRGRLAGLPLDRHPDITRFMPRGYDGPVTLVARLDERDRSVRRALMPLKGHHVAVNPRGDQALFSAMEGTQFVRFDPRSLAILDIVKPHKPGFIGGGHSAYTRDGRHLINTERRADARFSGRAADHRGRVVIRDAATLKVIEAFESHGIGPHDLSLMEADGLVAVANYGLTWQKRQADDAANPFRNVEPRMSLIDLRSGKLVDSVAPANNAYEIRHLAARDPDHLLAIAIDYRRDGAMGQVLAGDDRVHPEDTNKTEGMDYAPAPLLGLRRGGEGARTTSVMARNPLDFREGQTLVYDPQHDEVIGTFASSHTVVVIDAKAFDIKRLVRTDRFGLYFPRGVALHPDGKRYAVSGSWAGLYFFARGTHAPDLAATWHETFFHHSHITAAAAPDG
jgi:hypothetical protein